MNRREALRYTAYLTGAAISAPTLSALFSGCKSEPETAAEAAYQPQHFSTEEYSFIGEVTDTMLPPTDTPGARDVGVPEFIDRLVSVGYEAEDRDRFTRGLQAFVQEAQDKNGKPFAELTGEEKLAFLNAADQAARAQLEEWQLNPPATPEEAEQRYLFFLQLKELALIGYFTSQEVGTGVLVYDPMPGVYQGCIPVSEVGATWALS